MIKAEDMKLWRDVMTGVTRIQSTFARHDQPKIRIPIRDVRIPHTLDLHNMTVQQAYSETMTFIREAKTAGYKHVTIITGLSGIIRAEFPSWLAGNPTIRECAPINGGGAFKVKFFRKR